MLLLIWVMSILWKYLLAQVVEEDLEYFLLALRKHSKANICLFLGANISAKDTGMLTPLHRAAASRNKVPISSKKTNRIKGKVSYYVCVLNFSFFF